MPYTKLLCVPDAVEGRTYIPVLDPKPNGPCEELCSLLIWFYVANEWDTFVTDPNAELALDGLHARPGGAGCIKLTSCLACGVPHVWTLTREQFVRLTVERVQVANFYRGPGPGRWTATRRRSGIELGVRRLPSGEFAAELGGCLVTLRQLAHDPREDLVRRLPHLPDRSVEPYGWVEMLQYTARSLDSGDWSVY